MSFRLKVVLIIVMLLLLLYLCGSIKNNKITMKHSFLWLVMDVLLIISVAFVENLVKVANFFGIATVSNMMFFCGFVFLTILCFNLSSQLSSQNKKIVNLTQELGIMKKKLNGDKNEKH